MNRITVYFPLIGRVLLGGMFLFFGVQKLLSFSDTSAFIASAGFSPTLALLATVAAILVEVGAAALLIVGWKTYYAAGAIALFTIAVTFLFHLNWAQNPLNVVLFAKNAAILGGLLAFMAYGAGAASFDNRSKVAPSVTVS